MRNPYSDVRFDQFPSKEEAINSLIKELQRFKVHLPENFSEDTLLPGYGESVCFIVNDLTNRELIRRKFTFELPDQRGLQSWDGNLDDNDDLDDDIYQGSTVLGAD